ncbi:MAG: VOC family virulence protein [Gammaproteobacteria bacterium]|nr:MAG: VOC family virulence protein [Gammaproteobacteria bacterium]
MLEVAGIDHIVLRTTKLSEMLHFYCDVLGCKVVRETAAEIGLTQLRAGQALIDLITVAGRLGQMGGGPPTAKDNNLDHFCLQLQPISETDISNHLLAHNIDVGRFENRNGAQGFGPSIYINDPEGNVVELKSMR